MAYPDDSYATGSPRPWWRATPIVVVAAVVAVVLAASLGVAAGSWSGGGTPSAAPPAATTSPAVTASRSPDVATPSETPSATPRPTTGAPRAGDSTVPVYFVKDDQPGLRLYREFHPVEQASALAALRELVRPPIDADYRSLWQGAVVEGYERSGKAATVRLSGAVDTAGNLDGAVVSAALQQIVYTVTAAEADATLQVQVLVDGKPVGARLRRAPRIDTEGLIWLISPVEGAKTDSPVTLQGIASTFEANVAWEVHGGDGSDAVGEIVAHGNATATEAGPARAAWSAKVTLPPGNYVVRASAPDESDGEGKGPVAEDTKRITVP